MITNVDRRMLTATFEVQTKHEFKCGKPSLAKTHTWRHKAYCFIITHVWRRRVPWLHTVLYRNGGESFNTLLSPGPDPDPDHFRGGPSHVFRTAWVNKSGQAEQYFRTDTQRSRHIERHTDRQADRHTFGFGLGLELGLRQWLVGLWC